MTSSRAPVGVLFVCLGNICRSPTAEAVMQALAERAGAGARIRVDSAGLIESHEGMAPDERSVRAALRRGYDLRPLRARAVQKSDFAAFDHVLAMDLDVLATLAPLCPAEHRRRLDLFLSFAPGAPVLEVPDPFLGEERDFERVLDLVELGCHALVAKLGLTDGRSRR